MLEYLNLPTTCFVHIVGFFHFKNQNLYKKGLFPLFIQQHLK